MAQIAAIATTPFLKTRLGSTCADTLFLRSRNLDAIKQGGVFVGMTPQNLILNGTDLDEAVDIAMKEVK